MPAKFTKQYQLWLGKFGDEYLKRNFFSPAELDREYARMYGITRTQMNRIFLGKLDKKMRILEVGANFGMQLQVLQKIGFTNLYGIELNPHAVEVAKEKHKGINIITGDALDIPFKDNYFDLVFTSGMLIHIAPANIKKVLKEIHRVARTHIWGFEYFDKKYTEIPYRGNRNVLWKNDFAEFYSDNFADLRLVKKKVFCYRDHSGNKDVMFLFKKRQ